MKLTKEDIDKVRHIEGFPLGRDEDIIALSNPPYYTACPNPFIEDFIKEHGKPYDEETDDYHREPFAADVSEGKNDAIYNAHSYHTKVPYKAIMRYILHYTNPGDIIFDGFCGTGMTGVAAQMCGNPDLEFKLKIEQEMPNIKWGVRKAILNDLSPAATFIAYNYNMAVDLDGFEKEFNRIIEECEKDFGWLYETKHVRKDDGNILQMKLGDAKEEEIGKVNYTVWSDVLLCPNCGGEIVFWDVAVDKVAGKVKDGFNCKNCGVDLIKRNCLKVQTFIVDKALNKTVTMTKQVPVMISYTFNGKRFEKEPDESDLQLIKKIENMDIPYWYPTDRMCEGTESRRNDKYGITHVHHFFTKRNNIYLSLFYNKISYSQFSRELLFVFTASNQRANKTNRFRFGGTGGLSGTLYIPSLVFERTIPALLKSKYKDIAKQKKLTVSKESIVNTSSLTSLQNIPDDSFDYLFTDPPFGDNLNYSELSFLWETWLKVLTNNKTEAIVNKSQQKKLLEYQELMTYCFKEYFRVLKPGRWMTVEFHNSKNAVWNAIQESLQRAGFVVADVRTLDKQQGSFKQVNNTSAVKQDLVISAYKPKETFIREFIVNAGSEQTAWDFTRQHLEKLPVIVLKNGKIELTAERQAFLLFDRMVAYHIMNGISVPLDASDFYRSLDKKFMRRDGMYFLHDQVNEYDTARITTDVESIQMALFVSDEKTAIAWLYQQLIKPHTYAELQPKFMQEIRSVEKHEKLPELAVLLDDNFIQNDQGKWYIPDVTKAADVIRLREKKLLKEFEEYLNSTGKLKLFRTEAIRAGFAKLWKEKNYTLIVKTAERLPEKVIQEDDKLLMYYDISLSRV